MNFITSKYHLFGNVRQAILPFFLRCFFTVAFLFTFVTQNERLILKVNAEEASRPAREVNDAAVAKAVISINGLSFPRQDSEEIADAYRHFFDALKKEMSQVELLVDYKTLRRAIRDVETGKVDAFFPTLCSWKVHGETNIRLGSEGVGYVVQGLFSRQSIALSLNDLDQAPYQLRDDFRERLSREFSKRDLDVLGTLKGTFTNKQDFLDSVSTLLARKLTKEEQKAVEKASFPFIVSTEKVNEPYMNHPSYSDISLAYAMQSLIRKRIDAYVFPVLVMENYIKMQGLENEIHRSVYNETQSCFIVSNSERGNFVDAELSKALRKLKENGKYDEIFGQLDSFEKKWAERYQ